MSPVKSEQKAALILEKGMQVLWANGYNGTSVNDIVKAADVPKGSFYFYFESKEDFVVKALNKYFETMYQPVKSILSDESLSPKNKLIKLYEFRISIAKDKMNCRLGCLASNLGNEMAEHSETIRQTICSFEDVVRKELVDIAQQAQDMGEVRKDIESEKLVSFIEDTTKGIFITMKETQTPVALDNFLYVLKNLILK
jgi:TetR/AcrR family transcriptional repressor of nem operon